MVMEQVCIVLLDVWGKVPSSEPICPCVFVPSEVWWILKYSNNRAWSDRTALWCNMKTFYWKFCLFEKVHVCHHTFANSLELDCALYSKPQFTTNQTALYNTFYISCGIYSILYRVWVMIKICVYGCARGCVFELYIRLSGADPFWPENCSALIFTELNKTQTILG